MEVEQSAFFLPKSEVKITPFYLSDDFIKSYEDKKVDWSPISEFTFLRTYSRWIESGGKRRKERWHECVRRVVEGCFNIQKKHCQAHKVPWNNTKAQNSARIMFDLIFNLKFSPPGRGLWMMGTEYIDKNGGAALNNCAFVSTKNLAWDTIGPFKFIMDMSMLGVGVGFDTLGAEKINIREPKKIDGIAIVPDSREGWVETMAIVLSGFLLGTDIPKFDFSNVRPKGSSIRGFGGEASGPEPLIELIVGIEKLFISRIGEKIKSTDIVDLCCMIGKCVVSGNVRRSALLSLGEIDDIDFLTIKDPILHKEELNNFRWASNNSVKAVVGQDYLAIAESIAKNGEPGVVWLNNARRYGRMGDLPNDLDYKADGVNPCVAPETLTLTDEGYKEIAPLEGKYVNVWNGFEFSSVIVRKTGEKKKLLHVEFSNGVSLDVTETHEFKIQNRFTDRGNVVTKATKDLKEGDKLIKYELPIINGIKDFKHPYTHGFCCADGQQFNEDSFYVWLYSEEKKKLIENLHYNKGSYKELSVGYGDGMRIQITCTGLNSKYFVPYCDIKIQDRLDWFAGLCDGDGHIQLADGNPVLQVSSVNKEFLLRVRLMLQTIGIDSKVSLMKDGGLHTLPDSNRELKEYECLPCYRLIVTSNGLKKLYDLGWRPKRVKYDYHTPNRDASQFIKVVSVTDENRIDDTFCFTENKRHLGMFNGILTGQCGEQTLESKELCCLVETFPSRHETYDEYQLTLKYAYLYAKTVTLIPTHWEETNAVMLRNRRIGTSQSGIIDSFAKHGRRTTLEWSDKGYAYLKKLDAIYADWLCIPKSIKITSVKPSGTVSLLANVSPGIHYPHSEYYIRRVTVTVDSPLAKIMKDAGYNVVKSVTDKTALLIEFPIHTKYFVKGKNEVTMWEQFLNAADYQKVWSDNQVSITITFKKDEVRDIVNALSIFDSRLKSISMLPIKEHSYKQPVYEEISAERYEDMISKIKPADYSLLTGDAVGEKYCDTEKCTI